MDWPKLGVLDRVATGLVEWLTALDVRGDVRVAVLPHRHPRGHRGQPFPAIGPWHSNTREEVVRGTGEGAQHARSGFPVRGLAETLAIERDDRIGRDDNEFS